jgi:ElaB/YqjD/DUF883 family membrane-anchored ribosome-binding protein
MSLPKFESNWDGFRGHVSVKWDKLQEDELLRIQGNFAELISLIAQRYGEEKSEIESKMSSLYSSYLEKKEQMKKNLDDIEIQAKDLGTKLREKASALQENARQTYQKIREENIAPAVQKSEDYIKVHPFTAVLGALGIGLFLGGVIGLLSKKDR